MVGLNIVDCTLCSKGILTYCQCHSDYSDHQDMILQSQLQLSPTSLSPVIDSATILFIIEIYYLPLNSQHAFCCSYQMRQSAARLTCFPSQYSFGRTDLPIL